jgi:hypothetical protein
MWIVFGTSHASKRVPHGAQVARHCDACGEDTTFYEKELTSTLRLYFVDVLDYGARRVMQCGACGAHYATDELGEREREPGPTFEERLGRGAGTLGRMAKSVGQEIGGLAALAMGRPSPYGARRPERGAEPEELDRDDPALLDETERRFRELEAEADAEDRGKRS